MQDFLLISSVASWFMIILNLLTSLALVRRVRESRNNSYQPDILEVGSQAPDFSLETLDGNIVTLENYKDQEKLMVFVSPNCNPCRDQMPKLRQLYSHMETNETNLLLVSVGGKDETRDFMEEFDIESPVLLAEYGSSFASSYKIPGTPSYYLVNKNGQIETGGFFDDYLQTIIEKWIPEQAN